MSVGGTVVRSVHVVQINIDVFEAAVELMVVQIGGMSSVEVVLRWRLSDCGVHIGVGVHESILLLFLVFILILSVIIVVFIVLVVLLIVLHGAIFVSAYHFFQRSVMNVFGALSELVAFLLLSVFHVLADLFVQEEVENEQERSLL